MSAYKWDYALDQADAVGRCLGQRIVRIIAGAELESLHPWSVFRADVAWALEDGRVVAYVESTPDTEGFSGPGFWYVGTPE